MRTSSLILFSTIAAAAAFSPVQQLAVSRSSSMNNGLHMTVKVPITITGDNIDLTPALSDYVNEKVDRTLGKLSSVAAVSHCDVYLTVNKNPKVSSIVVYSLHSCHVSGGNERSLIGKKFKCRLTRRLVLTSLLIIHRLKMGTQLRLLPH